MRRVAEIASTVQIIEKETVRAKSPIIVIGFPSIGMVGSIAAEFLSRKALEMKEIGHIKSTDLLPVVLVDKGVPRRPIRILEKGNLMVIASELVVPPDLIPFLAEAVVDWSEDLKAKRIITIGAFADEKLKVNKVPHVFGVGATQADLSLLKNVNVDIFKIGAIADLPGLILVECAERKFPCIGLFARAQYKLPDPAAAAEVLKVLNRILGLDVDVQPLFEMAKEAEEKLEKILEKYRTSLSKVDQEKRLLYG